MTSFETQVARIRGQWPKSPSKWSYSVLSEVEACPRRWALRNATYPDLEDSRGYPNKPVPAALIGRVIHRSSEVILNALADAECSGLDDPQSAAAIRRLGGISKVVDKQLTAEIQSLSANPRVVQMLDTLERQLREQSPSMRVAVQRLLKSVEHISPRRSGRSKQRGSSSRLATGTHPEQWLEDETIPFVGQVDLLEVTPEGAEITDFKSGSPSPKYEEQVLIYAALWKHDHQRNPEASPVQRLRVIYPDGSHEIEVNEDKVEETRLSVVARVANAKEAAEQEIPIARPSIDNCQYCTVRHLCDDYWISGTNELRVSLLDLEIAVEEVRTATTRRVVVLNSGVTATLFSPADDLKVGDCARALELHESVDADTDEVLLRCGPRSELFRLKTR